MKRLFQSDAITGINIQQIKKEANDLQGRHIFQWVNEGVQGT